MFSYRRHPIQISIKVNSTSFSKSKRYHQSSLLLSGFKACRCVFRESLKKCSPFGVKPSVKIFNRDKNQPIFTQISFTLSHSHCTTQNNCFNNKEKLYHPQNFTWSTFSSFLLGPLISQIPERTHGPRHPFSKCTLYTYIWLYPNKLFHTIHQYKYKEKQHYNHPHSS